MDCDFPLICTVCDSSLEPDRAILEQHIVETVERIFELCPKPKQTEIMYGLAFEKVDTILIAKTGFGKSLIFNALPAVVGHNGIALILLPLLELEADQARSLEHVAGCKPFVLNGATNNSENRRDIGAGRYTHGGLRGVAWMNATIALEQSFAESVLRAPAFSSRLCLLAIDEAHVVEEWSSFRPAYLQVAVLRARLPERVPLFAASATLTDELVEELRGSCAFRHNVRVVKTPLDRPEIFLQTIPAKYPINGMLDLQHLLPTTVSRAQDIPKTIVFVDSCSTAVNAATLLTQWMKDLDYPLDCSRWVKAYFASMADSEKGVISQDFRQVSAECQAPRILIATEAYGMGVNNPDIRRIVQWLVPSSMNKVYQRAGRAGRNGAPGATFLMVCEPRLIGDRTVKQRTKRKRETDGDIQSNLTDSERRGNLNAGLWDLINAKEGTCLRNVGLDHFNAIDKAVQDRPPNDRCCINCHGHLAISTERHDKLVFEEHKWASKTPWLKQTLSDWRQRKVLELAQPWLQLELDYFMPNDIIDILAAKGYGAESEDDLCRITDNSWESLEEHASELLQIFQRCREIPFSRGSQVFEAWTATLGKRNSQSAGKKRNSQASTGVLTQPPASTPESQAIANAVMNDDAITPVSTQITELALLPQPENPQDLRPEADAHVGAPTEEADTDTRPGKKPKRSKFKAATKVAKPIREPLKEITLQPSRGGRIRKLPQKYNS